MPDALDIVRAYHQRSKHQLQRYAAGPETLDWDAQPSPWRRYAGAEVVPLPLLADTLAVRWGELFAPMPAHALDLAGVAMLLELSLGLAAWKQHGPDRWAVRCNPSSGNLHPTEAYVLAQGVDGLADGLYHYAPREHALERRAHAVAPGRGLWLALTGIHWREAWKYGERAWRYCQLDAGHALGSVRLAAAALGWPARRLEAIGSAELAALLGTDRDADYGSAEREEPELLIEIAGAPELPRFEGWAGTANRLDRHPMYRWPIIDEVAAAARKPATVAAPPAVPAAAVKPAAAEPGGRVADLLRGRRSAQRFDRKATMSTTAFAAIVRALADATRAPLDAWPAAPRIHPVLFAHRVDGVVPGAYVLPRSTTGEALLHEHIAVPWQPTEFPGLWQLAANPALAGTLRTINCHQALGSDATLAVALLAEFDGVLQPEPWRYAALFQEAGLLGQQLYAEAEAAGLRATGIGCFFDDALHELLGLRGTALQTVYHLTMGHALDDSRIQSEPPYAHLERAAVAVRKES